MKNTTTQDDLKKMDTKLIDASLKATLDTNIVFRAHTIGEYRTAIDVIFLKTKKPFL